MFCEYLNFLFDCDNSAGFSRSKRKQHKHTLPLVLAALNIVSNIYSFTERTQQQEQCLDHTRLKCVEILKFNLVTSRRLTEIRLRKQATRLRQEGVKTFIAFHTQIERFVVLPQITINHVPRFGFEVITQEEWTGN